MGNHTRRAFVSFAGKAAAFTGLSTFLGKTAFANNEEKLFIHHVYFWLKNPESEADQKKLIAGLKTLTTIKVIKQHHIGIPASTNRDVIDRSYSVSWLLVFKDKAAQDSYQVDPVHLKFVEDCADLWNKVVVYDSQSI